MERDGIQHLTSRKQPFGGGLQMLPGSLGIGPSKSVHRCRYFLPEFGGRQEVFVRHRLEKCFDMQMAETDTEKRSHALQFQIEQRLRWLATLSPAAQRLTQVFEGGLAIRGGAKGERSGGANALIPVIGQDQRRIVRYGVNVSGHRLLVVVRRPQPRRCGGTDESGRVPKGGVAVEESGHFLIAQVKRVVRRNSIRTQKDQLACAHALGLAKRQDKI